MIKNIKKIYDNNDSKRIFKNIMSLGILQITNYILPLIILPYLVITLGVTKFGILAFALAIINYFSILIDYGFNLAATREISLFRQNNLKISIVFNSVFIIKFFILIVSILIFVLLIFSFDKIYNEKLVYIFTFLMIFGKFLFPIWYFQGIEKMKIITILNILPKIIATISIFLIIKDENDYIYVPLINSIGFIVGGLIAFIIAIKDIKFFFPSYSYIKKIHKDSSLLFISNLSTTLFTSINILILGIFTNDYVVGIYSSIERLISALKNLFVPIYQGIFPWLSKKSHTEVKIVIKKLFLYIFLVSFIIFIILITFSNEILGSIYNKNQDILNYVNIFQILSFVIVASALNMLFNYLYLSAIKAYKIRLKIFLQVGLIGTCISFILTYKYGIYGITISFLFTEFLLLLYGLYYYLKENVIEK